MSTKEIKELGNGVKEGAINIFFKLLGGSWSLVAVLLAIVWGWLQLSDAQIDRIMQIEKLFDSWVGVAFIVAILLSYIVSLVGKLKEDIKDIFSDPVREMILIIAAMREEIEHSEQSVKETMRNIEEKFEKSITKGEVERGHIIEVLSAWKPFFEGK